MAALSGTIPEQIDFPFKAEQVSTLKRVWLADFGDQWHEEFARRWTATHHACKSRVEGFQAESLVAKLALEPLMQQGMDLLHVIDYTLRCCIAGAESSARLPVLHEETRCVHIVHQTKLAWLAAQALGAIESSPPLRKIPRLGSFSLHRLWKCKEPLSVARLQCIWLYWWQLSLFDDHKACSFDRDLCIRRHSFVDCTAPSWLDSTLPLAPLYVSSHLRIEDAAAKLETQPAADHGHDAQGKAAAHMGAASAVVDFANKQLHIGKVIPSCTQEEVMFSVRPEALLAIPVSATMGDGEVITIQGARQVCDYTGYGSAFRVDAFRPPPTANVSIDAPLTQAADHSDAAAASTLPTCITQVESCVPTILAMDALWLTNPKRQFGSAEMQRDLNKAYLSFAAAVRLAPAALQNKLDLQASGAQEAARQQEDVSLGKHVPPLPCTLPPPLPIISSGKWGCGVFNGDPVLKVLQQWAAASEAGAALRISTFNQPQQAEALQQLSRAILADITKCTVGGLVSAMYNYARQVLEEGAPIDGLARFICGGRSAAAAPSSG